MPEISDIVRILESQGGSAYFGESVTQLEHALEAAWLAEKEGAPDALVVAALLHDIGHLLHGLSEDLADQGVDGCHEELGAAWLERFFGPAVTIPVKLHVPAKRYLCAVDAQYLAELSPASVQSLRLQGGPMSPAEASEFEANPYAESGVRLRRWDDAAKIPGLPVPNLDHYRKAMQTVMAAACAASALRQE